MAQVKVRVIESLSTGEQVFPGVDPVIDPLTGEVIRYFPPPEPEMTPERAWAIAEAQRKAEAPDALPTKAEIDAGRVKRVQQSIERLIYPRPKGPILRRM